MKLHEIKSVRSHSRNSQETVTVEPAGGEYGEIDIDVTFHYEKASVTRHGDNYTFDEHHSASIEIVDLALAHDVHEMDENTGEVKKGGKTWKKGEDPSNLPGWNKKDEEYIIDKLHDKEDAEDHDDGPDPDDWYDRHRDDDRG